MNDNSLIFRVTALIVVAIAAVVLTTVALGFSLAKKNADDPHCPLGYAWLDQDGAGSICVEVQGVTVP